MVRIEVSSARGVYPAIIGAGLLDDLAGVLDREGLDVPRSVVTDTTVAPLYGDTVAAALGLESLALPGGEPNKRWHAVETTCRRWLDDGLDRHAFVLALGGGVVTDTVGFAAAVFLRGVRWIAAPTTLLGMVDAAVGGKTGFNLVEGKNLIGAFWPPRAVVADVATLATLAPRELSAGLAEVVKAAWIGDRDLLGLLPPADDIHRQAITAETWERIVAGAVAVKAEIVAADEHEAGRRKALNLGHTLGHALEAATAYNRFLHGEAVAWGLEAAAILGRRHGVLSSDGEAELRDAARGLGRRPGIDDLDPERVCSFIAADKKRSDRGVGWVLPTDTGVVIDQLVDHTEVVEVFRELQRG